MKLEHIPDTWTIQTQDTRTFIFDESGNSRCGTIKKDGTPCKARPMENGRCRIHGGKAVSGADHPNFTHGRTSRMYEQMPERLREIYQSFNDDAELNNLDPNIAILDARVAELLSRLEAGDYGATYSLLSKEFYRADLALRTKEMEKFAEHWRNIRELIERGSKDYMLWQEIVDLNEKRGRMVERKYNILTKAENAITINEFVGVLRALQNAFNEAVNLPTEEQRRKHFTRAIEDILKT